MARREKHLEKKKAKRAEKKRQLSHGASMGTAEKMARAASAPVLECALFGDDEGISQVLLSRQLRSGDVAVAVILVDRHCLGLKNGFGKVMPLGDYRRMVRELEEQIERIPLDPACARRLIEDAIAFARRYGFEPHPDVRKALPLFADIDPSLAERTFEFGLEGKPFYVSGPNDSPSFQRRVRETLLRTAGEGNFDYLVNVDGSMFDNEDFDDDLAEVYSEEDQEPLEDQRSDDGANDTERPEVVPRIREERSSEA